MFSRSLETVYGSRLWFRAVAMFGAFVLAMAAADVRCPIDDSAAYFTGKTQTISGHQMWEYKCLLNNHLFLVRKT